MKGWQFAITVAGLFLSVCVFGGALLRQFGEQTAEVRNNGLAILRVETAMNKLADQLGGVAQGVQTNRETNIDQESRIKAIERAVVVSPTFGRGQRFDK